MALTMSITNYTYHVASAIDNEILCMYPDDCYSLGLVQSTQVPSFCSYKYISTTKLCYAYGTLKFVHGFEISKRNCHPLKKTSAINREICKSPINQR